MQSLTAADGAAIHYAHHPGPAPALVLVHGLACDHTDWRRQIERFRGERELVAVDLRGHGRSAGPVGEAAMERLGDDVAALLAALDSSRAVLVGHSMGCRVVLEAADREPDRVAGLVLADGSRLGAAGDRDAPDRVEQAARETGVGNLLRGMFEQMFLDGTDPAVSEPIVARALATPEAVAIDLLRGMVGFDALRVDAVLQRVEVPLLVLQSTYLNADRVRVPMAEGGSTPWTDHVHEVVPHARIEIVTGAGHFNMLDAPDAFDAALDRFVREVT